MYYLRRIKPFFVLFMLTQLVIRLILTVKEWSFLEMKNIFFSYVGGAFFDVLTFSFVMIPFLIYLLILPTRSCGGRTDNKITHIFYGIYVGILLFTMVSEYIFWDEFAVRFNFIAVDYLVYMDEVVGNINESYPMPLILVALFLMTCLVYALSRTWLQIPVTSFECISLQKQKRIYFVAYVILSMLGYASVSLPDKEITNNNYANEIASNGIYSLFSAFKNNALEYDKFYMTYREVAGKDLPKHAAYEVHSQNPLSKKNVILVGMESMGAEFSSRFGREQTLTPVLDSLMNHGLSFDNLYATGTRTVTGLEALSLSIPPSPGKSIVKRQQNENLSSLGFVFKDKGYDTKFIYGGYGYFDNMNYFFENNGFDIVDRSSLASEEIKFANIWGVADESLFDRVINEADKSTQNQKPFFSFVMTTSNHRPYTFPENKAGIPSSGGGRDAGVRYADYAIGEFLEKAKTKKWFKNTVFVFVADHTAGASGKTSLPPSRYHIIGVAYAPDFIKPQKIMKIASQIDLPVTLLDMLGFDYKSKFFGQNILANDFVQRAYLTTNQKLGIYKNDQVTFIEPVKSFGAETTEGVIVDNSVSKDSETLQDVIKIYQTASKWQEYYQKFGNTDLESSKPMH